MILRIWLQVLTIFLVASAPLFVLEHLQHEEALQIALNSGPEKIALEKFPEIFQDLKNFAQKDPQNAPIYKNRFTEWIDLQKSFVEWESLKPAIEKRVNKTSLINAILLMALTLLFSFFVAKSIAHQFQKLLIEREANFQRLSELKSLTQWQTTARNLVHELRGPLTPIKLITSALAEEAEITQLTETQKEGLSLSLQKILQMEQMIQKFMSFAKLPEPHLEPGILSAVVQSFITHYKDSFSDHFLLDEINVLPNEPRVLLDEALLHNAFFALAKNAREALPSGIKGQILFKLQRHPSFLSLIFSNSETRIPPEIVARLFQIGASSKLNSQENFGIGLAMAKKIMLDHGGDLKLISNSSQDGVSFMFEFPIIKQTFQNKG